MLGMSMRTATLRFACLASAAAALALSTMAQAQDKASAQPAAGAVVSSGVDDPFEGMNRKVFAFNQGLDRRLIRPLAIFVHHATPRVLRSAMGNFLSNLGEPIVFINDGLQGRPITAFRTVVRFAVNTTLGVAGVFDVAGKGDLPHHDNGFGLTLARWGAGPGPYLYLPVVGPNTVRDAFGALADIGANPLTYTRAVVPNGASTGMGIATGLNERAVADSDLKALNALSTDQYAALRSFYLQNRQSQVTGGKLDLNALPDFDDPEGPAAPRGAAASASTKALTTPPAAVSAAPLSDAPAMPSPPTSAETGASAAPPSPAPQP